MRTIPISMITWIFKNSYGQRAAQTRERHRLEYEKTVRTVLEFLELDTIGIEVPPPQLAQTADSITEEWVQRFRQEHQEGRVYRGW